MALLYEHQVSGYKGIQSGSADFIVKQEEEEEEFEGFESPETYSESEMSYENEEEHGFRGFSEPIESAAGPQCYLAIKKEEDDEDFIGFETCHGSIAVPQGLAIKKEEDEDFMGFETCHSMAPVEPVVEQKDPPVPEEEWFLGFSSPLN